MFEMAKQEFGTTSDVAKMGYILPDGAALNLSEGWHRYRSIDHRAVERFYPDLQSTDAMVRFMEDGAIRVSTQPESGSIYLDFIKKPTAKQKSTLREVLGYFNEALVEATSPAGHVEVWREWGKPGDPRYNKSAIVNWMSERGLKGLGARAQADWVIVATDPVTGEQVTWNTSSHSEAQRRLASIRNIQWYADTEYGREAVRYQNPRIVSRQSSEGRGLGKVRAPGRTDEVFFKACREAGKPFEYFEPGGAGFIFPDGCFVQLDDHENIASYYPDDIMDTFGRAYDAVWDIVERGAVRVAWMHDENIMAFQTHKKPTPRQVRAIRELSRWAKSVYVDVQDADQSIAHAQGWEILSKREPGQVVQFMREQGFGGLGQKVAYPAGAPRGRLKFHWSPGAFAQALEVAESCSGPVKKVCQRQKHRPAGELVTCTWRDSSGRIVAGASGRKNEMELLESDGLVGRTTSLWSDRDLLAGRCPR